jgi:adenylate cyclase
MIRASEALLRGAGYGSGLEPWLPLGIGLDRGIAYVGNVGAEAVKDFTAIGDVVNTASRLQAEAGAGEIVMSERVHAMGPPLRPERPVDLELRGAEPVRTGSNQQE